MVIMHTGSELQSEFFQLHLQLDLFIHTLLRATYLLGIPVVMNFVLFYVHFAILTQAGPGSAFVSNAFQNSLEVLLPLTLFHQ